MDIIITITDEEKVVLDSWLGVDKIQEWAEHAVRNKIRQRTNASLLEHTPYNPKKVSHEFKMAELKKVKLPTREERAGTHD